MLSTPAVLADICEIDQLGDAIATLAARLHAATYELLVLLREFDRRTGWNNGFLSCAHPPSPKAVRAKSVVVVDIPHRNPAYFDRLSGSRRGDREC